MLLFTRCNHICAFPLPVAVKTGIILTGLTATPRFHQEPHIITKHRLKRSTICELSGTFHGGNGGNGGNGDRNTVAGLGGIGGQGVSNPVQGYISPSETVRIKIEGRFKGGRGGDGGEPGGNGGDGGAGLEIQGVKCDVIEYKGISSRSRASVRDGRDGRDGRNDRNFGLPDIAVVRPSAFGLKSNGRPGAIVRVELERLVDTVGVKAAGQQKFKIHYNWLYRGNNVGGEMVGAAGRRP